MDCNVTAVPRSSTAPRGGHDIVRIEGGEIEALPQDEDIARQIARSA